MNSICNTHMNTIITMANIEKYPNSLRRRLVPLFSGFKAITYPSYGDDEFLIDAK